MIAEIKKKDELPISTAMVRIRMRMIPTTTAQTDARKRGLGRSAQADPTFLMAFSPAELSALIPKSHAPPGDSILIFGFPWSTVNNCTAAINETS